MYSERNLVHILTILEAIEKCFIYVEEIKNYDDFFKHNDQMNYNASVTLLIAIGEESKNIEESLKQEFPETNWKAIAGMRDIMAHNYRGIDPEIVFEILTDNLAPLKKIMLQMLSKVRYNPDILKEAINSPYYKHIGYLK